MRASYVEFVEIDPKPKTRVWQVVPTLNSPKADGDIFTNRAACEPLRSFANSKRNGIDDD